MKNEEWRMKKKEKGEAFLFHNSPLIPQKFFAYVDI